MSEVLANINMNANAEEQKDTILEDMVSFKLGQEVTVKKIIFEDSDEEYPHNDVGELFSSSDEQNRTPPYINNVIILGRKKVNGTQKSVETNEKHTIQIETAKKAIEIATAIKNQTVEIKTGVHEDLMLAKSKFNEDEKQKVTGTNKGGEEKNGLGSNESAYVINNTHVCTKPLIISTTDDQPSDPKKCKRDFPRTKVTSTRDVNKFPGKMVAMLRHSEALNTSHSENSSIPVTSTITNVDSNPSSTNNNANFYDPHLLPMLTTVAENLLVIFPSLNLYTTAKKTKSKTDASFKVIKAEFEAMKFHCFCLSYTTVLSIIVPNKANRTFMAEFYNLAEQLARKRETHLFLLENFVTLCDEMIQYTEYKQKRMTYLLTNPQGKKPTLSSGQNNEKSSELIKMLQTSQKSLPRVSPTDSKDVSKCSPIVTFKAGSPGREIEITFNGEKQPQFPTRNNTNDQKYNQQINQPTNSPVASSPNGFQPNNPFKIDQPSNQNDGFITTPVVASSTLNTTLNNLPNIIAETDREDQPTSKNYTPAVTSNVLKTNQLFNNTLNGNDQNCQAPTFAVADLNNIFKTNVLINNNTAPVAAANLPLNFMDSFNTYLETTARDSSNAANPANCVNTNKKPGRQSRKKKIEHLQKGENTANPPNNAYQQLTYSVQPPLPYPNRPNQEYLPFYSYQMPQTYLPDYHKESPVQQSNRSVETSAPHFPGNQKESPMQPYSSAINPPFQYHPGYQKVSPVQQHSSAINPPAPHLSEYQKESPMQQYSSTINPPAPHLPGYQKESPMQQYSSAINQPFPHHPGCQKVSPVQQNDGAINPPAPHHPGYRKITAMQQYNSVNVPPASHHPGYQKESQVQQYNSSVNTTAPNHPGYRKNTAMQQYNSVNVPPASHHPGYQKESHVQQYNSSVNTTAPNHPGYRKTTAMQQYNSVIVPPASNHPGYQKESHVQQYNSSFNTTAPNDHGYQKESPVQQYSSAFNPPAPLQERSSVSRDSGFMSPWNEAPLNMPDQLDFLLNAADESMNYADNTKFQAQEIGVIPVITHVTSLDPNAVHHQQGNCCVCRKNTKYRCLGCNLVYYCRYECQLYDLPSHKLFCKATI